VDDLYEIQRNLRNNPFGCCGIFLSTVFGFPLLMAIGIGAALCMALAMKRAAFRAMRGVDVVLLLITSFAFSEILKVLFQNGISARPVPISFPASWSGAYQVVGKTICVAPTVLILATLASLGVLTFVLRKTAMGIAMGAAAEIEMLRMLDIKINRVVTVPFAISGLLTGVAAVIWTAQRGSFDPMMGVFLGIKAFGVRRGSGCWSNDINDAHRYNEIYDRHAAASFHKV